MSHLVRGYSDLDSQTSVLSAPSGRKLNGRSRRMRANVPPVASRGLPLLALVLLVATPSGAFAQGQQINTVSQPGEAYSITSDGLSNIFFPLGGYIGELPAGSTTVTYLYQATGSGNPYPSSNPIVGVVADVSGNLYFAVQNPIVLGTSGPYVDVYEITNQPVFFTGNTTAGSNQITGVSNAASLMNGQYVYGAGIPGVITTFRKFLGRRSTWKHRLR